MISQKGVEIERKGGPVQHAKRPQVKGDWHGRDCVIELFAQVEVAGEKRPLPRRFHVPPKLVLGCDAHILKDFALGLFGFYGSLKRNAGREKPEHLNAQAVRVAALAAACFRIQSNRPHEGGKAPA